MTPKLDPLLISAHSAGVMLGLSRDTVYRLARRGQIPCVRMGGRVRFSPVALKEWSEGKAKNA